MQQINDLLIKEVSRKEFLVYLSLILLTITGISGIWKSIQEIFSLNKEESGYGTRAYGN